ncbi:MAG TPA: hypothetical protein VNF29_02995 [Candidatus Binataceae bacterium]|nr:hypothetical protein [Candidatus Binataceae bacterium]
MRRSENPARLAAAAFATAFALVVAAPCARAQSNAMPQIQRQGGDQTLELKPAMPSPQNSIPPQSNDDNTRVIPVIPPNSQVLTLPQASTDFIGKWGGHLELTRNYGRGHPPAETGVSIVFGERDGGVVMATTVFGSATSQVISTKASTDGPRTVKLEVKGLELGDNPPLRHIEKVTLEMVNRDLVKCRKSVDLYVSGFTDPVMEAHYEGTLHPMTRREDRMLTEEAIRSGEVPRARIDQGNPPPPPPSE